MPHQCVRCGEVYPDGSRKLLSGCDCGSRFFFFIRKEAIQKAEKLSADLTEEDREQMEKDVKDLVGVDNNFEDGPVFLDIESIKILKPGSYELDLIDLFKKKPLVYKLEDGKYVIDLISTFKASKKDG